MKRIFYDNKLNQKKSPYCMQKANILFRIITVCTILGIISSIINFNINISNAANYSFNFTGVSEASKGDTVTLTITANGLTGNVRLSASNATLSDSQKWVEKNSVSITAKITAFPAKITATPVELTDNEYNIVSISQKTITINEKVVAQNTVTTPSGSTTTNPTTTNKPTQTTTTTTTGQQSPNQSNYPTQTTQNSAVKSSNNYLKALSINIGTLSPEFYRETFEYKVDNIIEEDIEVLAEAENEKATVNGTGRIALKDGENQVNIEVTAENGSVRTYKIILNKIYQIKQSDLRLESLKVEKINEKGEFFSEDLNFNTDTFEYVLEVEDDITDLNILPTVSKEGIIIETKGANNLQEGINLVNIVLTNQNDKTMETIYTLKVIKKAKPIVEVSAKAKNTDKWGVVISIIVILAIIGGIIWAIYYFNNKKKKYR